MMRFILALCLSYAFSAVAWGAENSVVNDLKVDIPGIVLENAEEAEASKAEKVEAKAEADIPVQLNSVKVANSGSSDLQTRAWLGFLLVLGAAGVAFLVLRRYQQSGFKGSQFQMKILSQFPLGPKKSLAVVRVAGESILIGVTDHHISLIKSLSLLDEDIPEEAPAAFGATLKRQEKKAGDPLDESVDQFALSSIQDVVSRRIKGLRSIE